MLFDLYVTREGWLHRLDPRTKFAVAAMGAILYMTQDHLMSILLILVAQHLLLLSGRIPIGRLTWVWRQLLRLMLFILFVWPWFAGNNGRLLISLGPFVVTTADVSEALVIAMRILGMSLWVFFILFTTRQPYLIQGLVRLGIPFEWGLILAIALRYIPTFFFMIAQIREAQAARAWQPRGNMVERLRGMIPLLVAFIVNVVRTGDTLGMALAARGVGDSRPRTSRIQLRLGWLDGLLLLSVAGLGYWVLRFG